MKQRKEEMVEKCLEAYFHLTVKGEECYLFQDKNGNLHKPYHKENELYVFLQESPKTDVITYVKELHHFCTKIIKYVMETKELKIQIPEGYCIDESKSTFEKIVFKKKDTKPRSWEEYEKMVLKDMGYKDSSTDTISIIFPGLFTKVSNYKFLQEHTAFIKLCMLRKAWIGDWKPDWKDSTNWCIIFRMGVLEVDFFNYTAHPLSFQTEEIAEDFMNCFKDLLEVAKPLL